jgi:hypothetical protein
MRIDCQVEYSGDGYSVPKLLKALHLEEDGDSVHDSSYL